MKEGDEVFLVNCDMAKVIKELCVITDINNLYYIVSPISDLSMKYYANRNSIRKPTKAQLKKIKESQLK